MDIFKGRNLRELSYPFKTDLDCKEYLSRIKWKDGFKGVKCNPGVAQMRKDFLRSNSIYWHTESAAANTLLHKVKFGVRKVFFISIEMAATSTKSFSASEKGVQHRVTEKTASLLMLKVRETMESSGNHPMDGTVHVDEFVIGGVEKGKIGRSYEAKKKKAVTAVQLTDDGKVRRMYAMRIEDFPARSLQYIFVNNISKRPK